MANDELISNISELNVNGYFDETNGYVTVWFHNNMIDKPDVVAYLKADMCWDVREVISETSAVKKDCEVITVKHNVLGVREQGSTFDVLVRKMLAAQVENEDQQIPESVLKMKEILDNNAYGVMVLN